jgi:hypothetical protein
MRNTEYYTQEELDEWLLSSDPDQCGIILKHIALSPSGQEKVVDQIRGLLQDTRFMRIQVPDIYVSIRLLAGYALASEQRLRGIHSPVVVKDTPLMFKTGDRQIWDAVLPYLQHAAHPLEDYRNRLTAISEAYVAGKLPMEDVILPADIPLEDMIRQAIHRAPLYV